MKKREFMTTKTINILLLSISGIFLILASTLVTYTIMNYISFKDKYERKDPEILVKLDNHDQKVKKDLESSEIQYFNNYFNDQRTATFISSVSFSSLKDINFASPNLQRYTYPYFNTKVDLRNTNNLGTYGFTKETFIKEFNELTGLALTDTDITNSSMWNMNTNYLSFTPSPRTMSAKINILTSYKVGNDYYFDLSIDNNIFGLMNRSVKVNYKDSKVTYISIGSTTNTY